MELWLNPTNRVLDRKVKADRAAVVLHESASLCHSSFERRPPSVMSHDPYSLPFSRTVTSLASRGCRITASRRVLVLPLGFWDTWCTAPDGS
jgi:hypothetical protein